jgi:hypothetical protein
VSTAQRAEGDYEDLPVPPVLTLISPEGLAAMAAAGGTTIGAPVLLPGPANGVPSVPCDHPDCDGP